MKNCDSRKMIEIFMGFKSGGCQIWVECCSTLSLKLFPDGRGKHLWCHYPHSGWSLVEKVIAWGMDQRWWRQAQKAKAKSALLMFLSGRSDATLCEKSKGSEWDIKNIWERDVWNRFCKLSWLSQQRCASKSQAQLLWSAFLGWREGCLIRGAEALPSLRVGRSFRFEDLKL